MHNIYNHLEEFKNYLSIAYLSLQNHFHIFTPSFSPSLPSADMLSLSKSLPPVSLSVLLTVKMLREILKTFTESFILIFGHVHSTSHHDNKGESLLPLYNKIAL